MDYTPAKDIIIGNPKLITFDNNNYYFKLIILILYIFIFLLIIYFTSKFYTKNFTHSI